MNECWTQEGSITIKLIDTEETPETCDIDIVWDFILGQRLQHRLKNNVYFYIMKIENFKKEYKVPEKLLNPYKGTYNRPKGWHSFYKDEETSELIHDIIIIDEEHWKEAIIHEIAHAEQAEIIGYEIWIKMGTLYEGKRSKDPFELYAYVQEDRWKRMMVM